MKAVLSNNKRRIKNVFTSAITLYAQSLETTTITTVFQGDGWRLQHQSLPVTTQTCRELRCQHNLCHAKCLEQLSNTSRWKTQKPKATFYKLTRHAGQEPLVTWTPQVRLELQLSAALGSWHPLSHPFGCSGAAAQLSDGQGAFTGGKAIMLHVWSHRLPPHVPAVLGEAVWAK